MRERWLYAWALGSVSFGAASLLVPLYLVELGGSTFQLGILAASAALIGAPGAILFGRLADRTTYRRPLVLGTLAMTGLVLGIMPLIRDIDMLIAANAALWLVVSSVAPVVTMLVVADVPASEWGRRIGLFNKYQGYGWAGGLVLGAVWPLIGRGPVRGWVSTRSLFWVLAVCAAVSALLAGRYLPRPVASEHVSSRGKVRRIARVLGTTRRGIKGNTFSFTPNRLYWATRAFRFDRIRGRLHSALGLYLIATALFFTGFAAFWAPFPLFLVDAGFEPGQIFTLYLASSLASAVLYQPAGSMAAKYDIRLVQSGALTIRGLLFPGFVVLGGLGAATVGFVIAGVALAAVGITWAFISVLGTAIVTRLAPRAARGEVLGIYAALGAVAGAVGGLVGGWVATFGYVFAFGLAGGLVILAAALVFMLKSLSVGAATDDSASEGPHAPPGE